MQKATMQGVVLCLRCHLPKRAKGGGRAYRTAAHEVVPAHITVELGFPFRHVSQGQARKHDLRWFLLRSGP